MLFKYLYKSRRKKYIFLFIFTVVAILLISFLDIMQGVMFMIFMNRAIGINTIPLWGLGLGALGFVVGYYLVSLLASYLINLNLKKIRGELVYDIFVSYSSYSTAKFLKEETPSSITSIITSINRADASIIREAVSLSLPFFCLYRLILSSLPFAEDTMMKTGYFTSCPCLPPRHPS